MLALALCLPAAEALAQEGLAVDSPARVANTDGDGVNLRESASAGSKQLLVVAENELVTIKGGPVKDSKGNSFYKVAYNGKTGYIITQYLIFAGKVSGGIKALPAGSPVKISGTDGDGVNLRQQPSAGTTTLAVLSEGTILTLLGGPFADKQGNNFYRVNHNGQVGYVTVAYISPAPRNSVEAGSGGLMKVANTDGDPIRFRNGPGRQFEPNGVVYEGQVVKVLNNGVKDDSGVKWFRVEQDGKVGYVDGAFLAKTSGPGPTPAAVKPAAPAPAPKPVAPAPAPAPKVAAPAPAPAPASNGSLGERMVATAKQYLGWRYVWGGKSPAAGGFDCSGFIYYVLSQHGFRGGSSVVEYTGMGVAVPYNALQPGDLLIWANTYMPGPSHIGFYIGGGKFIHAENFGTGVTIDDMSQSYYASRYVGARRLGA